MYEEPSDIREVLEFGDAMRHIPTLPAKTIEDILGREIERFNKVMSYITDFEWIEEPKFVYDNGSANGIDFLAQTGWYGKAKSVGYQILSDHFDAGRRYIPETITLDFVNEIIAEYLDRYTEDEEDE